jgi:hypothetical protein
MTMPIDTKILKTALYVGGQYARGAITRPDEVRNEIVHKMMDESIPDSALGDIEELVYMLGYFADSVRAAERKNRPIIPMHGEEFPNP